MLTETLWNGAMDREWVFNPLKARVASVPTQQLLRFLLLCSVLCLPKGFPGSSGVRISLPMEETQEMQEKWVQCLGQEDTLEKEMATHSSILAWRIQWTEEPGGLQSMGL